MVDLSKVKAIERKFLLDKHSQNKSSKKPSSFKDELKIAEAFNELGDFYYIIKNTDGSIILKPKE